MENKMKKSYKISRIILAVMTLIIFNIIFINEDESWKIIPVILATVAFSFSFPSSAISRKIIIIGNKIESKILKILYYVLVLPFISISIFGGLCLIMYLGYENIPVPNEMGTALGQSFIFLFLVVVAFIGIILPYIQTLIVLSLNHFTKK